MAGLFSATWQGSIGSFDLPIDDLGLGTRTQSNAQGRLAAEKEIKQDNIKAPAADIKERLLTCKLIEAALSINGFIFRTG